MKNKTLFTLIILIAIFEFGYSQTTAIPDPNFEQALIDLGYDDVIDGEAQTGTLASIGTLDVSNKGITDLTGIESFYILFSLDVSDNNLTTLNLVNNVGLNFLHCQNNALISLDLPINILDEAQPHNLTTLWCNDNSLSVIDVTQNPYLVKITCSSNLLTELDTSTNTFLESIKCFDNDITSINVQNNPALLTLWVHSNELTSLDITQNEVLTDLSQPVTKNL